MKVLDIILCGFLVVDIILRVNSAGVLTDAMEKRIVTIGAGCMHEIGATNAEMDNLKKGPPYSGKELCALACVFDKTGAMDNHKFSKQGFFRAGLPFVLTDSKKVKKLLEIGTECENEIQKVNAEGCEIANYVIECLKKGIPDIYKLRF